MPFEPGNDLASKPEADKLTAHLNMRCHPREKSAWVRAAKPGKLADWVRRQLNRESGHEPEPHEQPPKEPPK